MHILAVVIKDTSTVLCFHYKNTGIEVWIQNLITKAKKNNNKEKNTINLK